MMARASEEAAARMEQSLAKRVEEMEVAARAERSRWQAREGELLEELRSCETREGELREETRRHGLLRAAWDQEQASFSCWSGPSSWRACACVCVGVCGAGCGAGAPP